MRRVTAILLLLAFAGSGSGATAALHRYEHARDREHAGHADGHACHADGCSGQAGRADADRAPCPLTKAAGHGHDAGECRVCADLRTPAVVDRWDPAAVPVRAAAPLLRPVVAQRARIDAPLRIETTGPPLS